MSEWIELTDEDRERAFNSLPDMLDGFLKKWGWLHFAKAVEAICREKNAVPSPAWCASVDAELAATAEADAGKLMRCACCGGDGKETCHNPDHGFINSLSFHDVGRLGCPTCGPFGNPKVPKGGPCEECNGSGFVETSAWHQFVAKMEYDLAPEDFKVEAQFTLPAAAVAEGLERDGDALEQAS